MVRWTMGVLLAAAFAGAGCSAYVWERPQTSASVMEQDVRECDALAQQLSMALDIQALADRDWPGAYRDWPAGWNRWPRRPLVDPGSSLAFKMRTAQHCMEARGYRLIKQPPP